MLQRVDLVYYHCNINSKYYIAFSVPYCFLNDKLLRHTFGRLMTNK